MGQNSKISLTYVPLKHVAFWKSLLFGKSIEVNRMTLKCITDHTEFFKFGGLFYAQHQKVIGGRFLYQMNSLQQILKN